MRQTWADENADTWRSLLRALDRAADVVEDVNQRDEVCALLAAPNRVGVPAEVIRRTLDGRLIVSPRHDAHSDRYLEHPASHGAARPDPAHAAWFYAQMVRWGQAPLSAELLAQRQGRVPPGSVRLALRAARTCRRRRCRPIRSALSPAPRSMRDDLRGYLAAWAESDSCCADRQFCLIFCALHTKCAASLAALQHLPTD